MSVLIVPRSVWGAQPWRPQREMYTSPPANRTEFFTHYHGGPVAAGASSGSAMAKEIEAIHLGNGWAGVGYSWMTGMDGVPYEGRGWDLVCAACPDHNRIGYHAYVAVGGDQQPTRAALHTVDALYDEACSRAGRQLTRTWHGAHYPTECPGARLIAWVKAGMPDPLTNDPTEADVPTAQEIAAALAHDAGFLNAVAGRVWSATFSAPTSDDPHHVETAGDRLLWAARGSALASSIDTILGALHTGAPVTLSPDSAAQLAAAVAERLPPGQAADPQVFAHAVLAELGRLLAGA